MVFVIIKTSLSVQMLQTNFFIQSIVETPHLFVNNSDEEPFQATFLFALCSYEVWSYRSHAKTEFRFCVDSAISSNIFGWTLRLVRSILSADAVSCSQYQSTVNQWFGKFKSTTTKCHSFHKNTVRNFIFHSYNLYNWNIWTTRKTFVYRKMTNV